MNVVAAKKNRTESEFKSREYSFLFLPFITIFFTFDSYDNPYQQTAVVTSSKIKKPMKNTP